MVKSRIRARKKRGTNENVEDQNKASTETSQAIISQRKEVEVWMKIDHVMDIDTIESIFTVNFVYYFRWLLGPKAMVIYEEQNKTVEFGDFFSTSVKQSCDVPVFAIANMKEQTNEYISRLKFEESEDKSKVWCTAKVRECGVLFENLELKSFPFDIQDLTIALLQLNSGFQIVPRKPGTKKYAVVAKMSNRYLIMAEWQTQSLMLHYDWLETSADYPMHKKTQCLFTHVKVERTYMAYVNRIMIITGLVNLCVNFAWIIDHEEVGDRFGHVFAILLTAVAFQFIVYEEIPNLGYLTYLDFYVFVSYGYILLNGLAMLYFAFMLKNSGDDELTQEQKENLERSDVNWFAGSVIIWVLIQCGFFARARNIMSEEQKKIDQVPKRGDGEEQKWEITAKESTSKQFTAANLE